MGLLTTVFHFHMIHSLSPLCIQTNDLFCRPQFSDSLLNTIVEVDGYRLAAVRIQKPRSKF